MTDLFEYEDCVNREIHNTKVFISCMPYKHFCYYCMREIKEVKI